MTGVLEAHGVHVRFAGVHAVAGVDLNQSGLRYFDVHHTPDDTLDRVDPAQLQQNVAAWTTMLAVVADAPEEIGPVTRP